MCAVQTTCRRNSRLLNALRTSATSACARNMRQAASRYSDVTCIVDLGDRADGRSSIAALATIAKAAGIRFITFDRSDAALAAVDAGSVFAVIGDDPFQHGYQAIDRLANFCREGEMSFPARGRGHVNVPASVVRRHDAAELGVQRRTARRMPAHSAAFLTISPLMLSRRLGVASTTQPSWARRRSRRSAISMLRRLSPPAAGLTLSHVTWTFLRSPDRNEAADMARITVAEARKICTQAELSLLLACRPKAIEKLAADELKTAVASARRLRDKWRDVATEQRRETQRQQKSRVTDDNARMPRRRRSSPTRSPSLSRSSRRSNRPTAPPRLLLELAIRSRRRPSAGKRIARCGRLRAII